MKNRVSVPGGDQIGVFREYIKDGTNILIQIGAAIVGLVMSNSVLLGTISPFGISVCAAAPEAYYFSTAAGALIGYIISPNHNFRYILAVLLIMAFRWIFSNKTYVSYILAFIATLSSSIGVLILTADTNLYQIIICISEAIIAGASTFFFSRSAMTLSANKHYKAIHSSDIACIIISITIIAVSLMPIEIFTISVGRLMCIFIILMCAYYMKETGGAIAGIAAGIAMAVSMPGKANSYIPLSYGVAGLLAGVFNQLGKMGICVTFMIVGGLGLVASMVQPEVVPESYLYEILIACALFIVVPTWVTNRIAFIRDIGKTSQNCDNAKNLMVVKLALASNALSDIASTTQKISDKLSNNTSSNGIETIYTRCATKICHTCIMKMFCWNTAYDDTMNCFNDMTNVLKQKGRLTSQDLSSFMKNKCKNTDTILEYVNDSYNQLMTQKKVERKVSEVRGIVSDQFDGMSTMLRGLAKEFNEISEFDQKITHKVKRVLIDIGLNVYTITSFIDKYGRTTIEAVTSPVKDANKIAPIITLEVSEICDLVFQTPTFSKLDQNMKITIIEKATYSIDFGVCQFACNNAKACGDAYDYFLDARGKAHLILSDGMGTGGRAALDGAMTTGLLSRLIKAGFGFEASLKMVNSALLVKSSDESLATVDVASINLYTGETQICKAGAAPTFVRKSDRVIEVNCKSLPAGILRGISFENSSVFLKQKDIVVMVSDGVTNEEYNWIIGEIKSFRYNMSADEFARKIAAETKLRAVDGRDDDLTVMVGIIEKGV